MYFLTKVHGLTRKLIISERKYGTIDKEYTKNVLNKMEEKLENVNTLL